MLPTAEEIIAEARHGSPPMSWPPWRFAFDRLYLARTDDQLRQVRDWALRGLREHGDLPADITPSQAERPWQWPSWWTDAAWLRGTIAYLDWILGDQAATPVTREH
jgi:hypothetical protein